MAITGLSVEGAIVGLWLKGRSHWEMRAIDRQWVKDFGASDKSQAVYELAAWLDSLGLKLTVENVQKVDR